MQEARTIPSRLTGSAPRAAPRGLRDARQHWGWEQPSRRAPTLCLLAGGGVRHPRPIRHRGRCVGREAGAEWSTAAGKTLPPGRLALSKAAQMRIRAATFPRAAHMCQVKRGFGSTALSRGTRTSGWVLGSLPLRPAPALRGSRRPMRLFPGREEKSSRGCWGDWFFQRGCSSL